MLLIKNTVSRLLPSARAHEVKWLSRQDRESTEKTRPLPATDPVLGSCERQLAWGFQSRGGSPGALGEKLHGREQMSMAALGSHCPGLPGSSSVSYYRSLPPPHPQITLASGMRLSTSPADDDHTLSITSCTDTENGSKAFWVTSSSTNNLSRRGRIDYQP